MDEPQIVIACPFCGAPTEVEYASTGTSIECIGDDGCHALIVMPCFPHEAERLIRAGGLAHGATDGSRLGAVSWLDALIERWERKIERWESGGSSVKRPDTVRHVRILLAELRADGESASNGGSEGQQEANKI